MAKAKKPTTKKTPEKTQQPAIPPAPVFDTTHAAHAAAALVASGLSTAAQPTGDQKESGAFKNLKQNLLKSNPTSAGGSLIHPTSGNTGKKSTNQFGFGAQRGRNQTFGADVNRAGVPRRTGGG